MKRQQAAEDAIALHLASAETGKPLEYLPPGRIFGMQVTSPEQEDNQAKMLDEKQKDIQVSPASVDMLSKLFPNKKRAVLELVLKRCNHDLLKAIEHFNVSKQEQRNSDGKKEDGFSAFKPVGGMHSGSIPFLGQNKILMHSIYPFLPILNTQPILSTPLYVPGHCECEECKYALYSRVDSIL